MRTAIVFLCVWLGCGVVVASEDPPSPSFEKERETLQRMVLELEYIKDMSAEAERHADRSRRITFQYPWFRRDIERVQHGIREYLAEPDTAPRPIPPLRGDYRQ